MEKVQEALKTLESTLEKYRINKTKVSPTDLEGRYKVSFQKLKEKLRVEAEAYLNVYCFSGFRILQSDSGELMAAIDRSIRESQIRKRVGRAVFKNFSLQELQEIAKEQRQRVQELYAEYFHRHTCLYANGPCWDEDNPRSPLIYNDLVDKFWDEGRGEWISQGKPPGDAVLIFIQPKEVQHEEDR